jgi:hypothetical protein
MLQHLCAKDEWFNLDEPVLVSFITHLNLPIWNYTNGSLN